MKLMFSNFSHVLISKPSGNRWHLPRNQLCWQRVEFPFDMPRRHQLLYFPSCNIFRCRKFCSRKLGREMTAMSSPSECVSTFSCKFDACPSKLLFIVSGQCLLKLLLQLNSKIWIFEFSIFTRFHFTEIIPVRLFLTDLAGPYSEILTGFFCQDFFSSGGMQQPIITFIPYYEQPKIMESRQARGHTHTPLVY